MQVFEKGSSKPVLFALAVAFNLGLVFLSIPSAIDRLMVIYHISYLHLSILISALFWSHALMQIPAGMIADRIGVRRAIFLCLCFLCLGNLLPVFWTNFPAAIAARVIAGIGTGLGFVTSMKLTALHVPPNRVGMYQGFLGGVFSLGGILSYLVIPAVIGWGWEFTYLVPLATSLCLVAFMFQVRLKPAPSDSPRPLLSLGRVFLVREGWILGAYHAIAWGSIINLGNWIPSLLADAAKKATTTEMAWGGALVMLISGLGRMSGGLVLLRVSSVTVAYGSLLILAAIFIVLFVTHTTGLILALALLAAWFSSINFGALFQLASQSVPTESLATMMGFINFLANLSAILVAVLFGWLRETTGSFTWAFPILSLFALLAVLLGQGRLRRFQKNRLAAGECIEVRR